MSTKINLDILKLLFNKTNRKDYLRDFKIFYFLWII